MTITTDVENYPGFADVIQGPWLMEQMKKQAQTVGTQFVDKTIIEVDFSKKPFSCLTDNTDTLYADSIIIATGASARWLGLESEKKLMGYGVSACATCDGFFFKNKVVCVVGGGNTAVEEALYLTHHAKKVILIHRKNELRAEKILQNRLFSNSKVKILWNTVLNEVLGDPLKGGVTGVKLSNTQSTEQTTLNLDGVFIAIGHSPNTNLFKGQVDMDQSGYLITQPDSTKTNIQGIFASGDVQDHIYRQAVTAAGTGCMAALEAEKFLSNLKNT
jgi:thioredoxin reductase (NADPH)